MNNLVSITQNGILSILLLSLTNVKNDTKVCIVFTSFYIVVVISFLSLGLRHRLSIIIIGVITQCDENYTSLKILILMIYGKIAVIEIIFDKYFMRSCVKNFCLQKCVFIIYIFILFVSL